MKDDLNQFLESFQDTGIYIVDRSTMEVYYENATVQKYNGASRMGEPCFWAHGNKSMCASCPLRKEERTSCVIREDIGMIFDVEAMESEWNGKEAYTILVRKQKDIPRRNSIGDEMINRMNRVLKFSVLTYCEVNMSTFHSRSFHFSATQENHVVEGDYEDHLRGMCEYYVHPEDIDAVKQAIGMKRLVEMSENCTGPSEISVRYRSREKNGHSQAIESTAYILRDELPHYVSIITREVTEEERLNMKLSLYNEVVKNVVSIYHFNLSKNKCVSTGGMSPIALGANDCMKECRTMDDFCTYIVRNIPEGEMRQTAEHFFNRKQLLEVFQKGETIIQHRFPFCTQDGTYKWLLVSFNIVENPVTHEVEAMLHSEEIEDSIVKDNLIAQVINNDYDYIMLIDVQNNKARSFTNYGLYTPYKAEDAQNFVEEYLRKSYAGDDLENFIKKSQFSYIKKKLEQQEKYILYYNVREQNGSLRYKKGTYSYSNGDRRYLIFTCSDHTEAVEEEKAINEKLKQALKQSDLANKAKMEIFSRMSHDLRTPMNAIVGMANLGREEAKDETIQHYFEKIDTSGTYLLGLINDILDMNRLEYGKVELHEEPVAARKFLADVIEMIHPLIQQKKIQLLTDFIEMKTEYVFCDIIRTRQIFINFLSNAIKFSAPGSSVEWIGKDVKIENGRIYYEMKFIDHGCGMSKEFQTRVFEPFEQENNEYSTENPSTGLGLAITKNLVNTMGGSIALISEIGHGSTFILQMNHRIAKESNLREKPKVVEPSYLYGKKIMIVEDHPLNLEIEQKLLQKEGAETVTAWNGQIALDKFIRYGEGYFDAILMDVKMPVMDGLEAARRIRKINREDAKWVPIIATTANAFEEDRRASREAGMNAHLSKPIVPKNLFDTLKQEMLIYDARK